MDTFQPTSSAQVRGASDDLPSVKRWKGGREGRREFSPGGKTADLVRRKQEHIHQRANVWEGGSQLANSSSYVLMSTTTPLLWLGGLLFPGRCHRQPQVTSLGCWCYLSFLPPSLRQGKI